MKRYRKKPVVIEAVIWTGKNELEIIEFMVHGLIDVQNHVVRIETLEGTMTASVGDWIIKGVNGEFYPCKPDVFKKTYEIAE